MSLFVIWIRNILTLLDIFCDISFQASVEKGWDMTKKSKHEETNPRLKASFLQVVDTQLDSNDPPETRQTFDRLVAQGISQTDAKLYIAQAVCIEVFSVLKNKTPFNQTRYVKNLQRLPEEPQE